ncbi:hypothetical protein QYE76_043598 [Lolium multiflorum]|uniref:Uncharacterized protein n=1 Tax=Lolium multiflorum TaxID=4521 RepID=A0AAD8THI6_LOLMU|nr:hypothetical protein QYE76_043598 [Lolium multiflorum]
MLAMTGHAKKLSDLGIVIPNRLGINRVLQSLLPSYKNFVMNYNMQNMNKELPELFAMLKSAEIEIKKEHQVLMVNKTTSFKKQGKSKGKNKKSGNKTATPLVKPKAGPKPDAECYYCKEKGHWSVISPSIWRIEERPCQEEERSASSKQCTVAKSSTESEYIAASEASSEAVWMKRFIVELGVVPSALDPLVIYCDNMGAITNAHEPSPTLGASTYIMRGKGRGRPPQDHNLAAPLSGRPPLPNPSRPFSSIPPACFSEAPEFSTATDTPSSVGFKRSYYFRCPLEREVDVVFINNRTCDRVRVLPVRGAVIKIFYALLQAASDRLPQQQEPHLVGFGISSRVRLDNPLVATVF